tara:strand:+ start:1351 stop:1650 length:300 start_codon:yes stop_codon:yes gene_type:complete
MERITIIHNGKTLTVFKKDVSEKVWQELKDERPLNTAGDFKSIDGVGTELHLENTSKYWLNLEDKESKDSTYLFNTFLLGLSAFTVIYFVAYLIYDLLK